METEKNAAVPEKEADLSADYAAKSKVLHRSAPNRQKFEKDISEIKSKIEDLDEKIQKIHGGGQNSPQCKLQQIREKREAANERRKLIVSQLDELKKEIDTKRDAASQMRSKLQYQSEKQIEDMARKLELQLQQHSFRLSEERRLVAEIDKLRRSKKAVHQYNEAKEALIKLRESQQSLRVERDLISNNFSLFRVQEDEIHGTIRKSKEILETFKKELSILHEKKRNRVSEYKEEQALFVQFRDHKRAEVNKIRQQEKQAIAHAKAEERREILSIIEPYEEERQLCATLLSFLGKMELQTPVTPSTPASCYSSYANTPLSPDEPKSPLFRDEVEDKLLSGMEALYCGIPRRHSKKLKRSGSKASQWKKRPLTLTPDLLVQFDKIRVKVPVSAVEIPSTIEAIKVQQKLYSRMAAAEMAERSTNTNMFKEEDEEKISSEETRPSTLNLSLPLFCGVPPRAKENNNGHSLVEALVNGVVNCDQPTSYKPSC